MPFRSQRFTDRADAGQALAAEMRDHAGRDDVIVLALPRGGVPVAYELARELDAPLDVFLVRKLGVPGREELAMGAIATGGGLVFNQDVVQLAGLDEGRIRPVIEREREELRRRERAYRDDLPPPELRDRTVILVDDGLATGATMRAAIDAIKQQEPARLVVAVPVAPPETCREIEGSVDEIVCLLQPEPFLSVGTWYADFSETTDEDVRELLAKSSHSPVTAANGPDS
jgi:putative phosphoribosyl transferase